MKSLKKIKERRQKKESKIKQIRAEEYMELLLKTRIENIPMFSTKDCGEYDYLWSLMNNATQYDIAVSQRGNTVYVSAKEDVVRILILKNIYEADLSKNKKFIIIKNFQEAEVVKKMIQDIIKNEMIIINHLFLVLFLEKQTLKNTKVKIILKRNIKLNI